MLFDIYWANALFASGDRDFNLRCAEELRQCGYSVFLPQEADHNQQKAPSEIDIFENDTNAILNSRVLVACIDHETIDCGVACEIGVAYMMRKPIIGLYTDIRKDRKVYQMYKNPYIIGAITKNGTIVHSISEVRAALTTYL